MSIFSMKPKENKKISEAELQKAKAGFSLFKQSGEAKKESDEQKKESKAFKKDAAGILIAPHMTEKAMQGAAMGGYVFRVRMDVPKPEIKKAVEKTYGVHVTGLRIITVHGKRVRLSRSEGRSPDMKKAMVTLKKGETIQI